MIRVLGFDADDTLWHNENIFEQAHEHFRALLARYHPAAAVDAALFATEMQNLRLYGYGVKGFTLNSIQTAITLTQGAIRPEEIQDLLALGREMLAHPVELLPGVAEILPQLAKHYRLIVITKGDLHHQERKIAMSGLAEYFSATEILSEKDDAAYGRILARHGIEPAEFAMVGNSLKSDIVPVLALGGAGIYVPYHITWAHERVAETPTAHPRFREIANLHALPAALAGL